MNKRYIILITLILLAICGLRSETLQEQYQKVQDYKTDIFRQTKQFIIDNPDSPNVPKLYYNLAELSTSIYREEPDVILDLYKKVLKYDPDFYDKEVILYNIAYYSYKIAKNRIEDDRPKFAEKNPSFITWPENLKFSDEVFAEAKEFYSKIMQEYNYTDYYEESIFKMALLFSDIANDAEIPLNYYKKSAAFLSILLNRESVSGELRTDALFQRAWAYYSMSEWDKTISDFSEILRNDDAYTKLYYHDFAIENVAYSLVGIDSTDYFEYAESADYFVDEYAELFSDENNDKIIEEVIKLKLDLNAPMQAGDYYMARIRMNSLSIKSPTYIDSVLSLYTNYASLIREGKIYREVVKETSQYSIDNYGYNSEWYTSNRDNPEFMAFFNSIRDKFSRLETYYNNDLINETSVANYQKYIDLVNDYAAIPEFQDEIGLTWLNDKKDNMINFGFQLAESTGETEYYLFTYNLILDQEKINPDTTIVYRNENRLFQAAQNAYFKLKETVKDTTYFDSMNSIEITATYLDSLYIDGSARFYSVVTSDQFYNEDQYEIIKSILWNRSVINQELGNNNAVTTDLSELLKYDNDRIRVRDIYIILAQLHEGDKDFANSELYYAKAVEFANDEEDKEELEKSYLAQIDKNVTGLAETLDYIAAANEQLRLASKFDATTDAETVYDLRDKARGLFYQGGDYQRTIDIILKNAEFKSEKSDIHSLYYNAWAIADTLLSDSTQVMSIQNRFVSKFPTSNESFSIIIGQLVENAKHPQTRYDAATGYLDLHTKARNNSIDIGENKVEDIYKSAVNIYLEDEITNQDTLITLMQEFEKAYPNDPNSMDYLKYIAKIYLDTDETKYEEIAHYIYKKDPTVDLYSQIAYQKIDEVVKKVEDTFKNQDWDLMNQHISEVRELEKYYVSKDVTLDMVQVNEWFEYYQTEYTAWKEYQDYLADRNDFLTSYDKRLKSIRNTWVNAKDISIFRVNSNTEFKTHILNLQSKTIDKSKNRIQYVYKLASKKEQELVKLSQESTEWNMDVERKIRLFYVSAEIWDHAQKVVSRRLRYYYGQSNEVYEMKKTYGDDATKNLLDLKLKPATDNFVNMYNQEAINRYLNVYNVFVDGTGYTDKNIENMMPKILDLIPSLEVFDNTPGSNWIVENYVLAPQDSLSTPELRVETIEIFSTKRNLNLAGYSLGAQNSVYVSTEMDFEILPTKCYLQFAYPDTTAVKFWINGTSISGIPTYVDSVYTEQPTVHYLYRIDYNLLNAGKNSFAVRAENVSDTTAVLALNLQVAYDTDKLKYFRTTAEDRVTTNYQWKTTPNYSFEDSTVVNWVDADAFDMLYPADKIYDMEETTATWVYTTNESVISVDIDETSITDSVSIVDSLETATESIASNTSYFKKEFIGYDEVISASLKFAAVEKATIWLNGSVLSEGIDAFLDDENNAIFSNPVDIDTTLFNKDLNTIIVKVEGSKPKTGIVLEMNLVYKKGE